MSNLSVKQQRFTRARNLLEQYMFYLGYELTCDHAMRCRNCPVGLELSTHKEKLAQDYNSFKNGKYLIGKEAEKAFNLAHDFWDMLGGAKRIKNDLRHFSFKHNGVR